MTKCKALTGSAVKGLRNEQKCENTERNANMHAVVYSIGNNVSNFEVNPVFNRNPILLLKKDRWILYTICAKRF